MFSYSWFILHLVFVPLMHQFFLFKSMKHSFKTCYGICDVGRLYPVAFACCMVCLWSLYVHEVSSLYVKVVWKIFHYVVHSGMLGGIWACMWNWLCPHVSTKTVVSFNVALFRCSLFLMVLKLHTCTVLVFCLGFLLPFLHQHQHFTSTFW